MMCCWIVRVELGRSYQEGDRHASPDRIYPATPTTKVSEVTRHGKDGVQCSRDSQECKNGEEQSPLDLIDRNVR